MPGFASIQVPVHRLDSRNVSISSLARIIPSLFPPNERSLSLQLTNFTNEVSALLPDANVFSREDEDDICKNRL